MIVDFSIPFIGAQIDGGREMIDLELDYDEAIILQAESVGRYIGDEEYQIDELYLTNKCLVLVSDETEVDSISLGDIKTINNQVLVKKIVSEEHGLCMQIQFTDSVEYFVFDNKPKIATPEWVEKIIEQRLLYKPEEKSKKTSNANTNENTTRCVACGELLAGDARFCSCCGAVVGSKNTTEEPHKRKVVYEGEIHKCPNCGEVLKSFELHCPTCFYEIRGNKASSNIQAFADELERLEASGGKGKKQRIINHIRTFPIPTNKEDLYEFTILAGSNIREDRYSDETSQTKKDISDAWVAKFEQAYRKAKVSFKGDPIYREIEELYREKMGAQSRAKRRSRLLIALPIVGLILFNIIAWGGIFLSDHIKIENETERLEAIVSDVYVHIENEEYDLARSKASSLVFSGSTTQAGDQAAAKWDITRNELLDIIDKAQYGADYVPQNREIRLGFDKDDFKDEDYQEIKKKLKNRGFTNIKTEPVYDLTTGWWTSEGSVDKVSINGETVYSEDTVYSSNVEIIIYYHALKSDDSSTNKKTETKPSAEQTTTAPKEPEVLNVSIDKGSAYTYGHDEWDLYVVTAISDTTIKIEKWGKTLSSQKSFSHDYDVGAFKITESENGFCWLDEEHTAFKFILTDKSNSDFKKSKEIIFTTLGTDSDTNKGANYSKNKTSYKYQNDDWHLYRAVPLSDNLIKIECWYRSMAIGSFNYGYDVCVIDLNSNSGLEWSDNTKSSFTISFKDPTNSDLKKEKFVVFEKE